MQNYRVKGAFFENIRDTGPAFTGFIEIDGVKTQIALWPKTSAKGQNYLQVAEDKRKDPNAGASAPKSPFKPRATQTQPPPKDDDMDDTIPF